MANVENPLTNVQSGYTIITQVLPSPAVRQNPFQTLSPLQKFLKGEPKVLGAVQIIYGLLMLIFGFMFLGRPLLKFVIIGIPFWGSLLHITAAILTISASKTLQPCAVKSALAVNILGALTAAMSILTLVSDLQSQYGGCFGCVRSTDYISGILGILLVFSLLQFTTSISISVFACKATCSNEPNLNINNVVPNPEGYLPVDTSFPGHQAELGISTINNVVTNSPPVESPPAYTEIKSESDN